MSRTAVQAETGLQRALMSRPKLMMMDEPSLGLAPFVVKGIFEIIREINRQGVTVIELPFFSPLI